MTGDQGLHPLTYKQLPGRIVFGARRRMETPHELGLLGATRLLVIGGSQDPSTVDIEPGLTAALRPPLERDL